MDLFTLDLVSTGLQLDLKDIPLQQGGGSHHISAKIYIFSLEIWILLSKKKRTVGNITETGELSQAFLRETKRR